jgi:hypothetical protein
MTKEKITGLETAFSHELSSLLDKGFGKRVDAEFGSDKFSGIILPCDQDSQEHCWLFCDGSIMVTQGGPGQTDEYIDFVENPERPINIKSRNGFQPGNAIPYIDFIRAESVTTIRTTVSSPYARTPEQRSLVQEKVAKAMELVKHGYKPMNPSQLRDIQGEDILKILQS